MSEASEIFDDENLIEVSGYRMNSEQALAVAKRLVELGRQIYGSEDLDVIPPEAVVEDAKNKKSPLHPFIFSETEREAAYQRRLDLARHLCRSIKMRYRVEGGEVTIRTFAHVRVKSEDEDAEESSDLHAGYAYMPKALREEFSRQYVFHEALRSLKQWMRKNAVLSELAGVLPLIEQSIAMMEARIVSMQDAQKKKTGT